jgi:hypothetical protein
VYGFISIVFSFLIVEKINKKETKRERERAHDVAAATTSTRWVS